MNQTTNSTGPRRPSFFNTRVEPSAIMVIVRQPGDTMMNTDVSPGGVLIVVNSPAEAAEVVDAFQRGDEDQQKALGSGA